MRIQVVVDDPLGSKLQTKAHDLGLSTSSYVRYLIKKDIDNKQPNQIDLAIKDVKDKNVEEISFQDFKKQLKELY